MLSKELNIRADIESVLISLREQKGLIFLDSSKDGGLGRYSIFMINPYMSVKGFIGDGTTLDLLEKELNKYKTSKENNIPFIGGACGYLTYDFGMEFEFIKTTKKSDLNMPDIYFNFYYGSLLYDSHMNKYYYNDYNFDNLANERLELIMNLIKPQNRHEYSKKNQYLYLPIVNKADYFTNIQRIREYIEEGDIYQVNYTVRFEKPYFDEPINSYLNLRIDNPAPFASFINGEKFQIISASPERFFELRDRKIVTRPIKGTIPRSSNIEEDEKNRNELQNSEKNKAELLMIVDLERNDLSKIAKTGTVKVEELFKIESYSTVFHLVSTISATLLDDIGPKEIFKSIFPGGSITGAPKKRAMEVIDELEPNLRGLYTGSIGYIDFNGDMDFNIVIRTCIISDNKAFVQVGGGITYDSNPLDEYNEMMQKGLSLFRSV
jgi:para-aminobenzoate synthetase component 1